MKRLASLYANSIVTLSVVWTQWLHNWAFVLYSLSYNCQVFSWFKRILIQDSRVFFKSSKLPLERFHIVLKVAEVIVLRWFRPIRMHDSQTYVLYSRSVLCLCIKLPGVQILVASNLYWFRPLDSQKLDKCYTISTLLFKSRHFQTNINLFYRHMSLSHAW